MEFLLDHFLALLLLALVEARFQDLHGGRLVLVLAALVLALGNDVGGQMGDAHRGAGLVDVLSARAAGAEEIDSQILLLDGDVDLLFDVGHDEHGGEAGVAALVGVKGRDAHQPVHAHFGPEPAEGVFAAHGDHGGLDAGFFARDQVDHRAFKVHD